METTFVIEESDAIGAHYKTVHKMGCKDVRDPERVTFDGTLGGLLYEVEGYGVAYDLDELRSVLMPCTRGLVH